jgi:hypothetical protein
LQSWEWGDCGSDVRYRTMTPPVQCCDFPRGDCTRPP